MNAGDELSGSENAGHDLSGPGNQENIPTGSGIPPRNDDDLEGMLPIWDQHVLNHPKQN